METSYRKVKRDIEKRNRLTDRQLCGVFLVAFAVAWVALRTGMPYWQIFIVFFMTGLGMSLVGDNMVSHGHD